MTSKQAHPTISPDDVRLTIDDLRRSWGWLLDLVEPSRQTSPSRATTDDQAEILAARGMADRAYRSWNLSRGMSALAPAPAAAALDAIDAQVAVQHLVLRVARMVATSQRTSWVGGRGDPVLAVLGWLDGTGRRLAPWVVDPAGAMWRRGLVDDLTPMLLTVVDADLRRADRTARQAARVVGQTVQAVRARCPACGRRSLQLDCDDPDSRRWVVRCVSRACLCSGVGCGCLQRSRVEGRRHAWSRGELAATALYGLSTAVAVAAALAGDRSVHSNVSGHGGWSSRW